MIWYNSEENKDVQRIAIIAIITSIFYYTSNYIKDHATEQSFFIKYFEILTTAYFGITLSVVVFYLILLSLKYSYDIPYKWRIHEFLYDLIAVLNILAVGFTLYLFLVIWIYDWVKCIHPLIYIIVGLIALIVLAHYFLRKHIARGFDIFK